MAGLGEAASVIAAIQILKEILFLCGKYYLEVKDAKKDRQRLCDDVTGLIGVLEKVQELAKSPKVTGSSALDDGQIKKCSSELEELRKVLDPGTNRRVMRRLGLRALMWPFTSKDVDKKITMLDRHKTTFNLALAVDTNVGIEFLKQNQYLSRLPHAEGAAFDSYRWQHEPQCLPDTRVDLLRQIMAWSASTNDKCIFWLNGMAGTGKSTIARTIAGKLDNQKRLGASFFFSRGEGDLANATKFFGTLASQLAKKSSILERHICQAIAERRDIAQKSLRDQWEHLIHRPLAALKSNDLQFSDLVLVIDALDECENQDEIRVILRLLAEAKNLRTIRLRIFVTSRPETPIQFGFRAIGGIIHQDFVLHSISQSVIQHDISIFLKDKLEKIKNERALSTDWPGEENIHLLVQRADCLFIYAATVCRFIGDPQWLPEKRLRLVLQGDTTGLSPEEKLDEIYTQVLAHSVIGNCGDRATDILCERFRQVVGPIVILFESLSAVALAEVLHVEAEVVKVTLSSLHSVLDVAENQGSPIRLLHPSFRDFLLERERCSDSRFWINKEESHKNLAERCLQLLSKSLRRNLCNLHTPGALTSELKNSTVEHYLPASIHYACLYWVYHIRWSKISLCGDNGQVHRFLQDHFLHWLEALSLLGEMSRGILMITDLQSLLTKLNKQTELLATVNDAKRFILTNRSIIEKAPLQTYYSALVFSPKRSIIRQFSKHLLTYVKGLPVVEEDWNPTLQILEGHSGIVYSVAFSPDGQQLASGSDDNTVMLWDAKTGARQSALEGHSGWVCSVEFSPDGQQLASGSGDKTVILWDAKTGARQSTLDGHSDWVRSVAFSPDGQQLASGSDDKTVILWDAKTGARQSTLEGHSGWVGSVAFSPDGQQLASGSNDKTVILWDAKTGARQSTLGGHSGRVRSVAFSPDGQQLASGSGDNTVMLWDAKTGARQSTLDGHSDWVGSVAFSPDGQHLVSGSDDNTVMLWDAKTGARQSTLEGHSGRVYSVEFSPDGQQLASGSGDKTVMLWDAKTGARQSTLEGHSGWVGSVAFSPDSQQLASGSDDNTVMLWDAKTGARQSTLEGHSGRVYSVEFSPDGQQLASGSGDKTVILWDAKTGARQSTLEGHSGPVYVVAFSPDGQQLASGSGDKTVMLWDVKTGARQSTLEGHSGWVGSVAFSPDSQQLASGSYDKTVMLWDTETGARQSTLKGSVQSVTLSPDGQVSLYLLDESCQWITCNGRNVLFLPFDRRPTVYSVQGNTLAMGHQSGRVTVLEFDPSIDRPE